MVKVSQWDRLKSTETDPPSDFSIKMQSLFKE